MADDGSADFSRNSMGQLSLEELTKSLILPGYMPSTSMSSSPGTPNPVNWAGAPQDQLPFPGLDFDRNHYIENQNRNQNRNMTTGLETSSNCIENSEIQQNATTTSDREARSMGTATPKNEDRLAELRAKLLEQRRGSTPARPKKSEEQNGLPTKGASAKPMPPHSDNNTKPGPRSSGGEVEGSKITFKAPVVNEPVQSTIESNLLSTNRRASSADIESLVAEHRPISPAAALTAKADKPHNHTKSARGGHSHQINGKQIGHTRLGHLLGPQSSEGSKQGEICGSDEQEMNGREYPPIYNTSIEPASTGYDQKNAHEQFAKNRIEHGASTTNAKQSPEIERRDIPQESRRSSTSATLPEPRERSSINSVGSSKSLSLGKGDNSTNARSGSQDEQQRDVFEHSRLAERQGSPFDSRTALGNSSSQSAQHAGSDRRRSSFTVAKEGSRAAELATKTNTSQLSASAQIVQKTVPSVEPTDGEVSQPGGHDAEHHPQISFLNDQDVADWLEITDFHNVPYRDRQLKRFRRKRDLEKERLALEEEERQEWEERVRMGRTASAAAIHMPPPPPPSKEIKEDVGFQIKDMAKSSPAPSPTSAHPELATFPKRHHPDIDPEPGVLQPVSKAPRLKNSHASVKTPMVSPTASRPEPTEDRHRRDSLLTSEHRQRSRSPNGYWNRRSRSPPARLSYANHPFDEFGIRTRSPSPDGRYRRFRTPDPHRRGEYNGPVKHERPLEDRIQDPRPPPNHYRGNNRGRGGYSNFGYRNGSGSKAKKPLNLSANG